MGNRYGRNQKRKARQEIDSLKKENKDLKFRNANLQKTKDVIFEEAFKIFSDNSGLYELYVAEIGRQLGINLSDELKEISRKILNSERKLTRELYKLDIYADKFDSSVNVIRGEISPIRYSIAVLGRHK